MVSGAVDSAQAQSHLPYNGVRDQRSGAHLFINARIYLGPGRVLDSAMLLERNGRIAAVGANLNRPADATVVDLQGHWLFPALVELFAEVPTGRSGPANNRVWRDNPQMTPTRLGAYGANDAIRADQVAANEFKPDAKWAESFRQAGFGAINAHVADGLARGSSVLLAPWVPRPRQRWRLIKPKALAHSVRFSAKKAGPIGALKKAAARRIIHHR